VPEQRAPRKLRPRARCPPAPPLADQAPGTPAGDRAGGLGPFKRKCLVLALLETDPRTNATAAVGRLVLDLSEFACVDGQELRTLPVAVSKAAAAAAGGPPSLTLTVRSRWGKAGEEFTEDEAASMSTDQSGSSLQGGFLDFFTRRPGGSSGGGGADGSGGRVAGAGTMEAIGEGDGGGSPASSRGAPRRGDGGALRSSTPEDLDPSEWAGAAAGDEREAPAPAPPPPAVRAQPLLRVATPPGHSPEGSPASGGGPRLTRVVIERPAAAAGASGRVRVAAPSGAGRAPGWGVFARYRSSSHEQAVAPPVPPPVPGPPSPPLPPPGRAAGAAGSSGSASGSPERAPSSSSALEAGVTPWPLLDAEPEPAAPPACKWKAVAVEPALGAAKPAEPRREQAGAAAAAAAASSGGGTSPLAASQEVQVGRALDCRGDPTGRLQALCLLLHGTLSITALRS
jgi:hypothetical protein